MSGIQVSRRHGILRPAATILSIVFLLAAILLPLSVVAQDATPATDPISIVDENSESEDTEEMPLNEPTEAIPGNGLISVDNPDDPQPPSDGDSTSWTLGVQDLQINCVGLDIYVTVPSVPSPYFVTLILFSGDPALPSSGPVLHDDDATILQTTFAETASASVAQFVLPSGYWGDMYLLAAWQGPSPDDQGRLTIYLPDCPFIEADHDEQEVSAPDEFSGTPIADHLVETPNIAGSVVPDPVASPQAVWGSPVVPAALPTIGKTPSPLPDGIFRLPFSSTAGPVLISQLSGIQGQDCDSHYEYVGDTYRTSHNARAIDFSMGRGVEVLAVGPGIVSGVSGPMDDQGGTDDTEISVTIDHENGYFSFYTHLSKRIVSTGNDVETGMKIGEVGRTGMAVGNHLHFAVFDSNDEPIDIRGLVEANTGSDTWDDEGFAVYCNRIGNNAAGQPIPQIRVTGQPADWTPTPSVTPTPPLTEYTQSNEWSGIVPLDASGFAVAADGRFYVVQWLDPGSAVHVYAADGTPIRHIQIPNDRMIVKLFLGPDGYFYAVVRYDTNWPGIVKYDHDFNEIRTFGFGCTISAFCGNGGFYAVYANVSVDPDGNVYVQDSAGDTVGCGCIWRFSADGTAHVFLSGDIALSSVYTVDPVGTVFVWRERTIHKYLSNGQELMSWNVDIDAYRDFTDIATDTQGNVYVIGVSRIVKYSNNGVLLARWDIPYDESVGPNETFELYITPSGTIYVRSAHSGRVLTFDPADPKREQMMTLTLKACGDSACLSTRRDLDGLSVVWSIFSMLLPLGELSDDAQVHASEEDAIEVRAVIADGIGTAQTSALPAGAYRVCLHANLEGPNGELVRIAAEEICQNVTLDGSENAPADIGVPFELNLVADSPSSTPETTATLTLAPTATATSTNAVAPTDTPTAAVTGTLTPTLTNTPTLSPISSLSPTKTMQATMTPATQVSATTEPIKTAAPSSTATMSAFQTKSPTQPAGVEVLPKTGTDSSGTNVSLTAILLFASVLLASMAVAQRRR